MIKGILAISVCVLILSGVAIPIAMEAGNDTLAVVVIEGQSNAVYKGLGVDLMNATYPIPDHNLYYYGNNNGPIYQVYNTLNYDDTFRSYGIHSMFNGNSWKIGTPDAALAYEIQKKYDVDVLVINVGISGANINFLEPQSDGGKYITGMVSHALKDARAYGDVQKCGFAWIQGESNKTTPVATYINEFNTKIMPMNESLGLKHCYMVQTRPYNSGNAAIAQLQIASTNPNVTLASTAPSTFTIENGMLLSDNLHYTAEGFFVVGSQIGEKVTVSKPDYSLLLIIPTVAIIALAVVGLRISKTS